MSFAIKAFPKSIVFIVLAGVFYEFLATRLADPNVPTGQVALVGLIGVMFTLGGVWAIAASFGFVESPVVRTVRPSAPPGTPNFFRVLESQSNK